MHTCWQLTFQTMNPWGRQSGVLTLSCTPWGSIQQVQLIADLYRISSLLNPCKAQPSVLVSFVKTSCRFVSWLVPGDLNFMTPAT